MDILAARKKAAERAKAAKETSGTAAPEDPAPSASSPGAEKDDELATFPPVPETTLVPDAQTGPSGTGEPAPPAAVTFPETPSIGEAQEPANEVPGGAREQESAAETYQEEEREMLAFQLGSEEYVVPVDHVQEVLTPKEITPVPHTPEYVLGVCSLRGVVLPIIDLHRRLGLAPGAGDEKSRIVVVGLGPEDRIGLFVDRVRGVVRFLPSTVRPAPDTIEKGAEFLQGIVRRDDRLFILLDVEKTAEI